MKKYKVIAVTSNY